MRKLTALKMSHFHRERHSVVVLILLYKIVKKKKKKEKEKAAPTICVLCVMACKTDSWLFDELAHNPSNPHMFIKVCLFGEGAS